jgi:magnesium-protoporphyrin IX monomethyl ester (oxidative) cyclase
MQVFRITTEICKQVFPVTLDVDNPAFLAGLKRLLAISEKMATSKGQNGVGGLLKRAGLTAVAGVTLVRMFLMRPQQHELPVQVCMAPAW